MGEEKHTNVRLEGAESNRVGIDNAKLVIETRKTLEGPYQSVISIQETFDGYADRELAFASAAWKVTLGHETLMKAFEAFHEALNAAGYEEPSRGEV